MVLKASKRKVVSLKKYKNAKAKQSSQTKIAIVSSLFNSTICKNLQWGANQVLQENGISEKNIQLFEVPGAFEIPLVAQKLAKSKKYSGVIALGCVIRGDTPHFEFVSLAATMGCLQAGLNTDIPVSFGVITVNTEQQAKKRSGKNSFNKGREAALALLDTLETLQSI